MSCSFFLSLYKLTIEHGKGEEVGEERVGEGSEQQGEYDEEGAAEAHLAVGEASEEGSVAQSDSVSKCRVHIDDGRYLAGGDAQRSEPIPEYEPKLLQYGECGELEGGCEWRRVFYRDRCVDGNEYNIMRLKGATAV